MPSNTIRARSAPRIRKAAIDSELLKRLTLPEFGRQPPASWMQDELPALLERWYAFGAFVGHRHRRRRRVNELCLVVMTSDKHAPSPTSAVAAIPQRVHWQEGRNEFSLPTDVIGLPAEFEHQAGTVFGPGDVSSANGEVSSIGAVVQSGVNRIACNVIERRQKGSVDYALLSPTGSARLDNLFRDQVRIGPVYTPGPADLHRTVYLLHGDGGIRRTRCSGVNGSFNAPGATYNNLILTDAVSESGDSGGALVDDGNRLWGFLLGRLDVRFSFYVPAQIVLDVAGVSLFQG
ncbi:hypothetical protein [Ideonella sp. BN130291]|uniref:hypothetical protein n=1 Tax=Ideonella sp. BN130291 TaxID=3112940 RepID=UPI002E26E1E1|nr:hypothetical protein [Ideonella sp. BN130291]